MVTLWNNNLGKRPARRLRFDTYPLGRTAATGPEVAGHSGRRLVIIWVLVVLVLAGGLALAFRQWRVRYRARADYGAHQVATAIDLLAEVVPPDVPSDAWRRTVAEAHAMLVAL